MLNKTLALISEMLIHNLFPLQKLKNCIFWDVLQKSKTIYATFLHVELIMRGC